MSWIHDLNLVEWDRQKVRLELRPAQRHKINFVRSRAEQLSEMIGALAGFRVQVTIDVAAGGDESSVDGGAPAAAPRAANRLSQDQKDQLMRHPLVRQVAEAFDASLIDVRDANDPVIKE